MTGMALIRREPRIEVITGVEHCREWTDEKKQAIIVESCERRTANYSTRSSPDVLAGKRVGNSFKLRKADNHYLDPTGVTDLVLALRRVA